MYRLSISRRHSGKSNLCFADGHSEALHPKQGYSDNRYWTGNGGSRDSKFEYVDYHYVDGEWPYPDIPAVQGS